MKNPLKITCGLCLLIISLVTVSAQTNLYTSSSTFAAATNGINTIALTLPTEDTVGISRTAYTYNNITYKFTYGTTTTAQTMNIYNDGTYGNTTFLDISSVNNMATATGYLTLTLTAGYKAIYFSLGDPIGTAATYNISVNGGSPLVYNLSASPGGSPNSGFVGIVDNSTTINTLKISIDPNSVAYGDHIDIFSAPTPEPSTVALAMMGGLAGWLFLRRGK